MPTLVSTQTFSNGNVLNADALTNHVIDATPLATFISGQTAVTAPAPADEFLIATSGASPAKKVSLSTLAANLPTGTSAASLAVTGATTLTGALTANGSTILGDAAADTLTVNATSSFGAPVTVSSDTTLGTAAVTSATWTRSTTTITVTKTAHGLTTGNARYFTFIGTTPIASSVLNGTYTVTVTSVDAFTMTVADAGDTVGTVTWYEKTTTISSTLDGSLQGNISVNVANVEQGSGDEFLIRDSSDSGKLKTVSSFFQIRAYGSIPGVLPTATTLSLSKVSGITTITLNDHGLRVGDVLWIDAATGITAAWYSVTEVPTANTFKISAGSGTATSSPLCYRLNVSNCGNVSSAFARSTTQSAMQINFTNKPSSANYTLNFSWSSADGFIYYAINTSQSSYLSADFIKTTNGFGLRTYRSDGAAHLVASGTMNFTALW